MVLRTTAGEGPLRTGRLHRRLIGISALALAASFVIGMLLTFELVLVNERSNLDRSLMRQRDHLEADVRERLAEADGSGDRTQVIIGVVEDFLALESPTNPYVTDVVVDGLRFTSGTRSRKLGVVASEGGLDVAPVDRLTTVHTVAGDLRAVRATLLDGDRVVGVVTVAGELGPAREEAFAALRRLAGAGAAGLSIGLLFVWFASRRLLAPLSALTAAAASTDASRLRSRVDIAGDDEVAVLADEFNAMLGRLDQATAEREQFLATISHEIRTPIAVARGSIEIAEGNLTDAPADVRLALQTARSELDRTTRLVGDLLALGRTGHGDFLHRRPTALSALAVELEIRIDGLGLDTVTVAPADDSLADIDVDRLLQAVLNCVLNGIEHNPPGTTVDVTIEREGPELVIRVVDDGMGVPDEARDRIFDPFARWPSERSADGSGLGLTVVDAVVTAHEGNVRILANAPGTVVEIRLPTGAA